MSFTMGLELELAGISVSQGRQILSRLQTDGRRNAENRITMGWNAKSDSSIPAFQNQSGAEIISGPLVLEALKADVRQVLPALAKIGAVPLWCETSAASSAQQTSSFACTGLHVHVDVSALSEAQRASLRPIYHALIRAERHKFASIFPLVPVAVQETIFCEKDQGMKSQQRLALMDLRFKNNYAKFEPLIRPAVRQGNPDPNTLGGLWKYEVDQGNSERGATNFGAFSKYGTVEFRQGFATLDVQDLCAYLDFLAEVRALATMLGDLYPEGLEGASVPEVAGAVRALCADKLRAAQGKEPMVILGRNNLPSLSLAPSVPAWNSKRSLPSPLAFRAFAETHLNTNTGAVSRHNWNPWLDEPAPAGEWSPSEDDILARMRLLASNASPIPREHLESAGFDESEYPDRVFCNCGDLYMSGGQATGCCSHTTLLREVAIEQLTAAHEATQAASVAG